MTSSDDSSLRLPAVVLSSLILLVLVGEHVLASVLDSVLAGGGGFPAWFPHSGSVGKTAVVYGLAFDALKFVVIPAVLVWLGYAYGRRRASQSGTGR